MSESVGTIQWGEGESALLAVRLYELSREAKPAAWEVFAPHHYLNPRLHGGHAFLAIWEREAIAFTSSVPMPSGTLRNAWREHRTVVLPDYQGMGLGVRLSDWLGEWHLNRGERFFSRTTHPRMSQYRDSCGEALWKPTSKDRRIRKPEWSRAGKTKREDGGASWVSDTTRVARSHEYLGLQAAARRVLS